jgi:hypothetical protein
MFFQGCLDAQLLLANQLVPIQVIVPPHHIPWYSSKFIMVIQDMALSRCTKIEPALEEF